MVSDDDLLWHLHFSNDEQVEEERERDQKKIMWGQGQEFVTPRQNQERHLQKCTLVT